MNNDGYSSFLIVGLFGITLTGKDEFCRIQIKCKLRSESPKLLVLWLGLELDPGFNLFHGIQVHAALTTQGKGT